MKRIYHHMTIRKQFHICAALVAMLLCGCSKEGPFKDSSSQNDSAIDIMPVMDGGKAATRASLYDDEDDLREDLFHTYSYLSATPTRPTALFFSSDARYSDEDIDQSKHRWLFWGESGYQSFYWPLEGTLDFFAYAPSDNGYVQINSSVNPPTFTATMPMTNTEGTVHQENMKEFLYAYTPARDKTGGAVPLAFRHPFSGIVFKVKQSQRDLTVKSITIDGVRYVGTASVDPETGVATWTLDETKSAKLDLTVNKIIPGTVNFGGELCGPYLVLPQDNTEGKELCIECHWKGYDPESDDEEDDTKVLKGKITNEWKASQIYTYNLDLGNSREEIMFSVEVTPWKYVYDHVFEIE